MKLTIEDVIEKVNPYDEIIRIVKEASFTRIYRGFVMDLDETVKGFSEILDLEVVRIATSVQGELTFYVE